ncbi:MAG TPA: pyridoxamine 5'-phosphate oxidase family protein [Nitrososphaeraceae archaeon]|nr:pyridoxamine 5'-phosphate oxidase family protein [Nitrososphaeraceae archaeon]
MATIDEVGDPNIQPLSFEYDDDKKRLFIITSKTSKSPEYCRNKKTPELPLHNQ